MNNYQKLIINIGLQKIFFLLSLISCSFSNAETLPSNYIDFEVNPSTNLSKVQPTLHARGISQSQINEMTNELQQLVNRVESTLISVEAKHNLSEVRMSDAVKNLGTKSDRLSNDYINTRTYKAIVNAKKVLNEFPTLARHNFSQARQIWFNARRDLWMSYPVDKHLAQPEIRAMWLDRGTIVKAKSKQDLEPLFDRMARAGINTVFMETLNASYPIYPSRVAPEQNPMTRGWDPLQASIELAHERGMELHAWLWAFAAANQGHNKILGQPQNYLGPVLSRHPDWVLKDQNGQVFNRTPGFKKAFFDPANPQVRSYLLSLIDEIVSKYDVDGIHLDYIRYPFQDNTTKQKFGYTNVSRGLFERKYGIDPLRISRRSHMWKRWTAFKVEQVSRFVEETSQLIKRKNPELILSTAVFPMERNQRLETLQQYWEDWSYQKSVDLVVLMTYALDTNRFQDRVRLIHDVVGKNSNFVIPGIRLLNVPVKEAFDKMQLIRNMPSGGFALFAAENFDIPLEIIFKHTQGNTEQEEQEPIPFRQPFATAASRYQALQQEWIFLLQNEQIKIDHSYLNQWSENSDQLVENLENLVENPSVENAIAAQKQLSAFKLKLSRYLRRHKQNNSWQVEAWMNRLITVENILKYGEAMVANQSSNNTSAFKTSESMNP